jgi:hypothetical protein
MPVILHVHIDWIVCHLALCDAAFLGCFSAFGAHLLNLFRITLHLALEVNGIKVLRAACSSAYCRSRRLLSIGQPIRLYRWPNFPST